ncbi:hypothetical protein [Paeniglutamicibacter sp.]
MVAPGVRLGPIPVELRRLHPLASVAVFIVLSGTDVMERPESGQPTD